MEFKNRVASLLVAEHNRTPEEAAALVKKHTKIVMAGIMRGLDTSSITVTATAIEIAESALIYPS